MYSDHEWSRPERAGPTVAAFNRVWRRHIRFQSSGATAQGHSDSTAPGPSQGTERPNGTASGFDGCPWLVPGKVYSTGIVGLHEEIEDFYQYITSTSHEHVVRYGVYERVKASVLKLWPHAEVHIFGSFETGLYLPTSDIDIVVLGKWNQLPLETLRDALVTAGVCDEHSVRVLDKAAVPIVKLTDRQTGVRVDISFNTNNGLVSVNHIKRYQSQYPHLPKLVVALKQFLVQRELNEVFSGGISSYSLILMVVSFLQTHERLSSMFPGSNLGVLFIEFFELYGIKFNYLNTCIKVKDGGYAPRHEVEKQFAGHSVHNSPLCIEDPLNECNDIGRSSYNMMMVKEAFQHAYYVLSFAVLSDSSHSDPNVNSILGRVIRISNKAIKFRLRVNGAHPPVKMSQSSPGDRISLHSSASSSDLSDNSEANIVASEIHDQGLPPNSHAQSKRRRKKSRAQTQ